MEKTLAWMFLVAASFCIQLGNFWFTFGIWPKSWLSFSCFVVAAVCLQFMLREMADKK